MGLPVNRSDSSGVQQFTFGTFLVGRGNRSAFEACSDLANLRELSPQPVMLVGPAGAGKTHLLYAMANRVRQSNAHVGLVCVSAHQFPAVARELARNPEQVERASRALLLIDQLDGFDEGLDELEGLVAVFAGRGHGVVLSSQEPPENLPKLSDSFRELLGDGTVIRVRRGETNGRANGARSLSPSGVSPSQASPRVSNGPGDADDQLTWDAVRTELGQAHTQLSMAIHEMQRLREVNTQLNAQLRDTSVPAIASPTPPPTTRPRHETLAVLQRTETLLNELRTSRVEFESLQATNAEYYAELRRLSEEAAAQLKDHSQRGVPATSGRNGDNLLADTVSELREENGRLRGQVTEIREECEGLRVSIAESQAEHDTSRTQLKHAYEHLGRLEGEVSDLRRRAARHDIGRIAASEGADEETNGATSSGGVHAMTPRALAAPLAQLEEAARIAAELEPRSSASDEAEVSNVEVARPDSTSGEAPPSSLYHVEEFTDDLDFMDDPSDPDPSTDNH